MWGIQGKLVDKEQFVPFEPSRVLYEFDGPRIFTFKDRDGELNLAYWSDSDESVDRYVIVPTSEAIVNSLCRGNLSVLEALQQPRIWLCDVGEGGEIQHCQRVELGEIPNDALPASGTMLWPSLEPIIALRAIGPEIVPGQVPGSVILSCVEGVQRAFKVLVEYILGEQSQAGRPKDFVRRLFDLPTQQFAFKSFEVAFRMPIEEQTLFSGLGEKSDEIEALEAVANLLDRGLAWVGSAAGEGGVYPKTDNDEAPVILRALKELTPSSFGNIQQLEVRGALLQGHKPFVLTGESRRRVNAAIRNLAQEPQIVDLEGRIRELDKDRLSFWLRDIEGQAITAQQFVFGEDLREEAFEAFHEEFQVKVAGETFPVRNLAYALAISRIETGATP